MTTSRTTRLVRTPSLAAFQDAILAWACPDDLATTRATAVIVPTRSAARQLRQTIEDTVLAAGRTALVLPDLLTRTDYYDRLRGELELPVVVLTPFEREAILLAAAHEAITEGLRPPFEPRPALVREMLALYDQLRRQQQDVDDFDRLLLAELEPRALSDRGAERMLRQTNFLAAAFRFYERRVGESGSLDEHGLRRRLLEHDRPPRHRHVVVTVGEQTIDPGGLWPVDYDLLTRLHGLEQLTVIATESQLAAGWLERVHALLPGIEAVRTSDEREPLDRREILVPEAGTPLFFTSRDREEEVARIARHVKARRRERPLDAAPLERTAVVFSRPLPYLYLARTLLGSAGIPFQCDDALPLAAEPVAAALDLVLDVVATNGGRSALVALLRSPHVHLAPADDDVTADAVGAFDEALAAAHYAGDPARLAALVELWGGAEAGTSDPRVAALRRRAMPAARAAVAALDHLQPLFAGVKASDALLTLHAFLTATAPRDPSPDEREARARTAVLATLEGLAEAHRRHGEITWSADDLAATVRRWLESQTFSPRSGTAGVHFVDAIAARYGRFDAVHLVGLVEGEWPDRSRRNLFYAPFLLHGLGWVDERSRGGADRAAFLDLLLLASRTTAVSTFLLEEDSLVEPSSLLEDLPRAGLTAVPVTEDDTRVFSTDALLLGTVGSGTLPDQAEHWLALRLARSPAALPVFHGIANGHRPRVHSVSALELYVQCPFKYFARYVLRLPEEVAEEDGLGPRDRGSFVHAVFQAFFARWEAERGGAITPATLDRAHAVFGEVAASLLERLSPADAALERTRLLGSPVSPGLSDLVFAAEAVRDTPVSARRLEDRFEGVYELAGAEGPRQVAIRGVVDRIDLLGDGTLRVIDYKSSAPQKPVQLAIYAVTSEQRLRGHLGRAWRAAEVAYLVFGSPRGLKPLARKPSDLPGVLLDAQHRVVEAIDAIERGEFPARPVHTHLCASCPYAGVCRKDHVTASDEPDAPAAV